jgi:hypothetical protein
VVVAVAVTVVVAPVRREVMTKLLVALSMEVTEPMEPPEPPAKPGNAPAPLPIGDTPFGTMTTLVACTVVPETLPRTTTESPSASEA